MKNVFLWITAAFITLMASACTSINDDFHQIDSGTLQNLDLDKDIIAIERDGKQYFHHLHRDFDILGAIDGTSVPGNKVNIYQVNGKTRFSTKDINHIRQLRAYADSIDLKPKRLFWHGVAVLLLSCAFGIIIARSSYSIDHKVWSKGSFLLVLCVALIMPGAFTLRDGGDIKYIMEGEVCRIDNDLVYLKNGSCDISTPIDLSSGEQIAPGDYVYLYGYNLQKASMSTVKYSKAELQCPYSTASLYWWYVLAFFVLTGLVTLRCLFMLTIKELHKQIPTDED